MLLESANRIGINIDVMQCDGFLQKPAELRKYISTLPKSDIVFCTDGYDVLYTQGEEAILSRFMELNAPLVFSGEKKCFHHFPEAKAYFERSGGNDPYIYLNSGLIIGYVEAFLAMLEEISRMDKRLLKTEFRDIPEVVGFFNDQTLYGRYACLNPGKIAIDTRASIFWTMTDEKYDIDKYAEINPAGITNLETHGSPCVVHVSHIRKFYPGYLYIAKKLGIRLTSHNVDLQLFEQHLKTHVNDPDKYPVPMDTEVRTAVERLPLYRFRKVRQHLSRIKQLCAKIFLRRRFHLKFYVQKQTCESAAIIFIGTGKYIDYFPKYYETSRSLFLPKTKKVYFAFTDDINHSCIRGKEDVVPVHVESAKWPFPTLLRFRYIEGVSKLLEEYSHIIFIDADTYTYSLVTEKEFFSHDKGLFGVRHPGCAGKRGPFEFNRKSAACVNKDDDLSTYWQGCFWGGRAGEVLTLVKELAGRIDDDLSRDIIARWHDESHLNKYFIEHKNMVYTYHPGYAYPEILRDRLPYEKKMVHLLKKHNKMRKI
jgi:hypothetical protein